MRAVAAHAVLAVLADAVEDRQDPGLEIRQVEPLAASAIGSRAGTTAGCQQSVGDLALAVVVFGDWTSSRRPFSIAALATSDGLALDQLERLLANSRVLVDQ